MFYIIFNYLHCLFQVSRESTKLKELKMFMFNMIKRLYFRDQQIYRSIKRLFVYPYYRF